MALLAALLLLLLGSARAQQAAELELWPQPAQVRASGTRLAVHPQLELVAAAASNVVLDGALRRYSALARGLASAATRRPSPPADARAHAGAAALLRSVAVSIERPEALALGTGATDDESYELEIRGGSPTARLTARTAFGAIYGLETLLQLLSAEPGWVRAVAISDAPQWSWRGWMIDAGRRFWPVPLVKNVLDTMAAVKLNVLHLHASDHCRWGVESKLFPQLTAGLVGQFSGHYSQADIKELIAYAKARAIRIVPEFVRPSLCQSSQPTRDRFCLLTPVPMRTRASAAITARRV